MLPNPIACGLAYLVLEDGSLFQGDSFGADISVSGEVVFCTSMTGYQEMLTDPSFAGQILVPTYPLMGNYGISDSSFESSKIQVAGFAVKEHCLTPSHSTSTSTLKDFLASQGVPGISGIDTRAVARRIRTKGVMMGAIAVGKPPVEVLSDLREDPRYGELDLVSNVSTAESYHWNQSEDGKDSPSKNYRIIVVDYGLKYNILRNLRSRGCSPIAVPAKTRADEILSLSPDGIVMSPGPGDPALLDYAVDTAHGLIGKVPILGICLGNQVLARCFGARNFKLKFGHRGANHPVRDLATGRVHITAQNHGFAVDPDTLPDDIEITHLNLNDNTIEGLHHKSLPVMSVQYHPEASPGPLDNAHIFDRFLSTVKLFSKDES